MIICYGYLNFIFFSQSKEPSGLKTSFVDAKSQLRQCVAYGNFVNSGIVEKESVLFVASKLLQQGPGSQRCSDIVSLCVERVMGPGAKESPSFPSLLSNFISILRDEANDQNFIIVDDNPSDPFVVSKDGFTQNQLNLITRGLVAPQAIVEMQKVNFVYQIIRICLISVLICLIGKCKFKARFQHGFRCTIVGLYKFAGFFRFLTGE